MTLRLLHILPSLDAGHGGPSRSVPQLCRALAHAGVDLTLFSTARHGTRLTIDPGAEPYEVTVFGFRGTRALGALTLARAAFERRDRFDLVHIHSLWNSVVTASARAVQAAGLRYVIAPRGMLDENNLRRRRLAKQIYSATVDRGIVTGASRLHYLNTAEQRGASSRWFRLPRSFVAPNGVDDGLGRVRRGSFRRRVPELQTKKLMLFLGRLHPIKGLDLQLAAFKRLADKHPDLVWVLAGSDDGEWPRLSSAIAGAGLTSRVYWRGPVNGDERFEMLADANVLVQTSFYECHSMAVNEALAVGTPLVITDSVHFDEVAAAAAGYVVARDPQALAAAIDRVLCDEGTAERMREAGRAYARDHLAWGRIAECVVAAYQEILA